MTPTITFAQESDENALRNLFLSYQMDVAGPTEFHVIVRKDDKIAAGAMIVPTGEVGAFHLAVFAVESDWQGKRLGANFLQALVRNPARYCYDFSNAVPEVFRVTTVAKGSAVGFYEKYGFIVSDFSKLAYPFDCQCQFCCSQDQCQPVAMLAERMRNKL